MARRSVLFTPGDRRRMLEGAAATDADVLVFDLEDGVAPGEKDAARETVVDVLREGLDADAEVRVRVNPVEPDTSRGTDSGAPGDVATAAEDVAALAPVADAIDGLVLPKVEDAGEVRRLAGHCRRYGLPRGTFALVETARGVEAAPGIAAADATDALVFGAEDLAASVGATRSDEGWEVSYARQRVLTAARAGGSDAIDTLWTAYEDVEGLREDARRAVALGYDGKLAIHPDQVPVINDAFAPDPSDVEWAERVLDAVDGRGGRDAGAVAVDGEMVDAPLVAQAERVVERARAAGELDVDSAADGTADGE